MPDPAQSTDPVAAELAAIHERQENGDLREFAFKDSPRLLGAVEAVLALHNPVVTANGKSACPRCSSERGRLVAPEACSIREAISAELLGEGSG